MVQSSRAGISYSDFWKMTPSEWAAFIEGYMLREEDAWQRTRVLYAIIYNTNVDHHYQKRPDELIPLPGDRKNLTMETPEVKYLNDVERQKLKTLYKI